MSSERERKFSVLYEENRDDIYLFLRRLSGQDELSLDLLQDTFINFIRHFKTKELPARIDCRKYLFAIARNVYISYCRSSEIKLKSDQSDYEQFAIENPESSYVKSIDGEKLEIVINKIIADLPEELQAAVILRFSFGLSLREISEIINKNTSAISKMIARAEKQIASRAKELNIDLEKYIK